jgi:hypothetical protein
MCREGPLDRIGDNERLLMNIIARMLVIGAMLAPIAAASPARADFVLEVGGQAGMPFTAEFEWSNGDSLEKREIADTVPARYEFDARALRVRIVADSGSGGGITATLLRDGKRVSRASGSGNRTTLIMQSGSGLPPYQSSTGSSSSSGTWNGGNWSGWGGNWGGWGGWRGGGTDN